VGSSQYLYNAKMREEIAEQLGVTPTPGGLEILLRQSENNRMAHGGIVHLADGGPLINPIGGYQSKVPVGTMSAQESADARAIANAVANRAYLTRMAQQAGFSEDYKPESTGDIVKSMFTPDLVGNTILSGMTGGLGPFMKWGGKQIWNKFGGQGSRTRLIQQMEKAGASQEDIDAVKNMSTHEYQKQMEGLVVEGQKVNEETGETETTGRLPFQDMSAGMSGASALMAMPVYSAMYNVGGSGGHGKGAGGNFGQNQRMIRKEQKKIKQRANKYDQFGNESWYLSEGYPPEQANYYANTFKNMYGSGQDLIDTMHGRGFGRGAYDAFERVAESPPESAADSRGRPQNWSEIFAHYQETGSFDESPEAQWGGG